MPIVLSDKSFTQLSEAPLSYHRGNTGDICLASLTFETNIRVSSVGNPILFDLTTNQLTSTSISWLEEGFRDGDSITLTKYDSGGNVLITWNATINWLTDTIIDVSTMQTSGYDQGAGEIFEVIVTGRNRDDLDVFFNQVLNGQTGGSASLIDGESTKINFADLESFAVTDTAAGILIPNQSGNYITSQNIERLTDTDINTKRYRIRIAFIVQGFTDSSWFELGNALKVYCRLEWSSIGGEPYEKSIYVFNDDADTGRFDEGFNSQVSDSTLIQGFSGEISYCGPTTFDIIVDGSTTQLGVGGAYIPTDDTNYKNLPTEAQRNLMVLPTLNILSFVTGNSYTRADGSGWTLDVNSVNSIGSETTINVTITPNAQFESFIDSLDANDRLFYLWVRCGNTNHLVYENQLICPPVPAGPLDLENSYAFLDHSENVEDTNLDSDNYQLEVEDDVAWVGRLLIENYEIIDSMKFELIAQNNVLNTEFLLQGVTFDFANIQISNAGIYLINEEQTIVTTLPTTSVKDKAKIYRLPSIDTDEAYGVVLYYPFLARWEYWLEQANANVDFYPTQNKDWPQYDTLPDWNLRLRVTKIQDGLAYEHFRDMNLRDYDAEPNVDSVIEIERISTAQVVGVIPEGETVILRAIHTKLSGNWLQPNVWAMNTVEPKEAGPRSICSTVLPFDNNLANPVQPISGQFATLTFPSPNVAVVECYFNPNLVNTINGVKFTAKIKEFTALPAGAKTTTGGVAKTTTTGDFKTIAP